MFVFYITSTAAGSGKTSIAAGIAKHLLSQNRKVGYLKPVIASESTPADNDVALMQRFLGLAEKADDLPPAFADVSRLRSGIQSALAAASSGKDVMLIEGPSSQSQLAIDLASTIDARIIGVEAFSTAHETQTYYKPMAKRLAGILLNKVPKSRLSQARSDFSTSFGGTRLLGIVPEDRSLAAFSVAELAEDVRGKIVGNADRGSDIIENVMLAAMNPDHGPDYYSLKGKKAVIVRSERPDMQLAALETPTTVLVLSGEKPPIPIVLKRAEAKGVPVISTKDDVKAIVAGIEAALRQTRLSDRKAAVVARLVEENLDFEAILK